MRKVNLRAKKEFPKFNLLVKKRGGGVPEGTLQGKKKKNTWKPAHSDV